jgi:hypothetical protein
MKTSHHSDNQLTAENVQEAGRGLHLPSLVSRCRCKYQAEKSWGYHLWKWVGGRKSWKGLGSATHIEHVVKYAAQKKLPTILIKCNGCGNEMIREYPAKPETAIPVSANDEQIRPVGMNQPADSKQ